MAEFTIASDSVLIRYGPDIVWGGAVNPAEEGFALLGVCFLPRVTAPVKDVTPVCA